MRNLILLAALGVALAGCDQAAEEADEPAAPATTEAAAETMAGTYEFEVDGIKTTAVLLDDDVLIHAGTGVGDLPRDAQHVVQVGMAEQDVVDGGQGIQRQVAHAGAGVDEDIVVQQEGGGLVAGGNGAGAAQDADVHAVRGLERVPRVRRGGAKNVRTYLIGQTVEIPGW